MRVTDVVGFTIRAALAAVVASTVALGCAWPADTSRSVRFAWDRSTEADFARLPSLRTIDRPLGNWDDRYWNGGPDYESTSTGKQIDEVWEQVGDATESLDLSRARDA